MTAGRTFAHVSQIHPHPDNIRDQIGDITELAASIAAHGGWEPDHFTSQHPLARKAKALCDGREHQMRRRVGKHACGECRETVIRADERAVTAALAKVSAS